MRFSINFIVLFILSIFFAISFAYSFDSITESKEDIVNKFTHITPKLWGEKLDGIETKISAEDKAIALTFDACGSPKGKKFDAKLIEYLEKEKIPATLFVSGKWIEANSDILKRLSGNPLFEIGNHGSLHLPASVNGRSAYGIKGAKNVADLYDEIEQNAKKIEAITGKKPLYYRSGTAFYDDVAILVAKSLGYKIAGYSLLGDAGATYSSKQVESSLLSAKNGDIVLSHFNHPESGTAEGVRKAIPKLKKAGFRFITLSDKMSS